MRNNGNVYRTNNELSTSNNRRYLSAEQTRHSQILFGISAGNESEIFGDRCLIDIDDTEAFAAASTVRNYYREYSESSRVLIVEEAEVVKQIQTQLYHLEHLREFINDHGYIPETEGKKVKSLAELSEEVKILKRGLTVLGLA